MLPKFCETRYFDGRNVAYVCPECANKYFADKNKGCSSGKSEICDICGKHANSVFSFAKKQFLSWIKKYDWEKDMEGRTTAKVCPDCGKAILPELRLDFTSNSKKETCDVCGFRTSKLGDVAKLIFIIRMGEKAKRVSSSK